MGEYILDFDRLLKRNMSPFEQRHGKHEDDENDTDRPIFSFVTGKYRHAKHFVGMSPRLVAHRAVDNTSFYLYQLIPWRPEVMMKKQRRQSYCAIKIG